MEVSYNEEIKDFYCKIIPPHLRSKFRSCAEQHFPELLSQVEEARRLAESSPSPSEKYKFIRISKDLIIKVGLKLRFFE